MVCGKHGDQLAQCGTVRLLRGETVMKANTDLKQTSNLKKNVHKKRTN